MGKLDSKQLFLYLAWLVSVIATLGSLYFSEIRGFIPFELCWYQRILMYPLSLLLGIATFQNELSIRKYVLPMAIIGWSISLYHYLEQKVPSFAAIKPFANSFPCSAEYINWLGFITIPFLTLVAFTLIIVFMLSIKRSEKN
ncbi:MULTISPECIES: disulfide oxidoreductase [Ornithinibacillus]|jgi:disulfide bond formation protein DsbB|uniref:disulfide oxidoreductase n=1 Tax=Ornithinibacillus TaxID=484508 RepID=UPI00064E0BC9|nr:MULTISPECIES: disulfide oxidoreductase [Ornithinibacillus]